ncbi:hypothetical protein B7P43_G01550 [Cryptotermes secundus]|uniref:Secreted protein n=1 Tax=Cryptotermes secundus TaxID=105785 RepID=A0A2J7PF32_9NEOP|nr:hypothetical protein B7P43_G01550 [Cryptotermes secundus]
MVFLNMILCGLVAKYQCFLGMYFSLSSGSSEILVPSCYTTWCHIPEHCNLNIQQHENVKSVNRKRYFKLKMQNINFT